MMTTWKSWDDLAKWFADLLEGRDELNEEMEELRQQWVGELEDREEIIETLFAKIANDVRYVLGVGARE